MFLHLKLFPNDYVHVPFQTLLVPQPSDDPNDPLNWLWTKKSVILFTISVTAFPADFQAGAGVPCIGNPSRRMGNDPKSGELCE
jgi:hypothetical protein